MHDLFPARLTCTSLWPFAVRGHLEEEGSKRIICGLRAPNCDAGARRASARGRRDRHVEATFMVPYRQTTCNSLKNISLGGLAEKIHRVPLTGFSGGVATQGARTEEWAQVVEDPSLRVVCDSARFQQHTRKLL